MKGRHRAFIFDYFRYNLKTMFLETKDKLEIDHIHSLEKVFFC